MRNPSKEEHEIGQEFRSAPPDEPRRLVDRLPGRITLRRAPAPRDKPGSPIAAQGERQGFHSDSQAYGFIKRVLDATGAVLLLSLLFPLMLATSLLIMISSPGPVLFRQIRLGRNGVAFRLFKFRTMAVDAERQLAERPDLQAAFEESYKLAHDPRITPVGSFLRRTSLDELPQLLNVIHGSMSLIGPRPIVPKELVKYGEHGPKLLSVKPGLGGHWQAHGRSDTTYAERIALDMFYIDHRSLGMDLALLVKTALAVFRRRGSY